MREAPLSLEVGGRASHDLSDAPFDLREKAKRDGLQARERYNVGETRRFRCRHQIPRKTALFGCYATEIRSKLRGATFYLV
jgi:hypothetical protein